MISLIMYQNQQLICPYENIMIDLFMTFLVDLCRWKYISSFDLRYGMYSIIWLKFLNFLILTHKNHQNSCVACNSS